MEKLATTLINIGRYKEVESHRAQVLKLRKWLLGPKHPETIRAMADLASTFSDLKRYDEAESAKFEVVELRMEVLGLRDFYTHLAISDLALIWHIFATFKQDKRTP